MSSKKILLTLIPILLILFSQFGNFDVSAATTPNKATVKASSLDVREKPSPKAKKVGALKKGTNVEVYGTKPGGWSEIRYNKKAAFVATSGLNIASDTAKELRVIKDYISKGTTEATKSLKVGDSANLIRKKNGNPSESYSNGILQVYLYKGSPNFEIAFNGDRNIDTGENDVITNKTKINFIKSGFKNNKTYTYAEIKNVFGKAQESDYNTWEEGLWISYTIGKYQLIFKGSYSGEKVSLKENSSFTSVTVMN